MDRETYKNKHTQEVKECIYKIFGNGFYMLPEGGSNKYAVKGCSEIISEIDIDFDFICCACGTGGTVSGLIAGLNHRRMVLGFPALKGASFLYDDVKSLLYEYSGEDYKNWDLQLDYHFGGYAKKNEELVNFIKEFYFKTNIELDFVYTGKMLFGIYDLIKKGYFKRGHTIIAVHTGGLPNASVLH